MSDYTKGSGNIFQDLGLKRPDEKLAKARLAHEILSILDSRRLTQTQAAKLLGIDQAKVSALKHGKLAGFSSDRLIRFLVALDHDVNITVRAKPKSRDRARVQVKTA